VAVVSRPELIGVSSAIQEAEIAGLTDREQDDVIKRAAEDVTEKLRKFVGGVGTYRDRPLVFEVTGPHEDPIQGRIHVHTVAGYFDLDTLPTDCDAYQVHVVGTPGITTGGVRPDTNTPKD
jgi:hypothetical protein